MESTPACSSADIWPRNWLSAAVTASSTVPSRSQACRSTLPRDTSATLTAWAGVRRRGGSGRSRARPSRHRSDTT